MLCVRALLVSALSIAPLAAAAPQDEPPPWEAMDYGPFLSTAVGLPGVAPVHKGIVLRLRTPSGDASDWHAVFDTDLLAWRCAWRGSLVLEGIVFNGPHGTFPEIEGAPAFVAPARPGFAHADGTPRADERPEPWGPIAAELGRWSGLSLDGHDVRLEYTLAGGDHRVAERLPRGHRDAVHHSAPRVGGLGGGGLR